MKVYALVTGPLGVNTYLISGNDRTCAVIDPGGNAERITESMASHGLIPEAVLLTHAHCDHIGAVAELQKRGAKVYLHEKDAPMLENNKWNLSAFIRQAQFEHFSADVLLKGGETLELAGLSLRVFHTPGHTPGGVSFLAEESVFTGDALFAGSIGRTDFPGGDQTLLLASVHALLDACGENRKIYPGHGAVTDVQTERKENPFLK